MAGATDERTVLSLLDDWGGTDARPLRGSNARFFEFVSGNRGLILRITPEAHREPEAVRGELDWMLFLHGRGAPVCAPITSKAGVLTQVVKHEGESCTACVFEKAGGSPVCPSGAWGEAVFSVWGRAMADLHLLAANYDPPGPRRGRLEIVPLIGLAQELLDSGDPALLALESGGEQLAACLEDGQFFGLTHCDLSQGNIRYRNGRLWIYDFDDCQYAPYIYDLAVVFYVTLFGMVGEPRFEDRASQFVRAFMRGYRERRPIGDVEIRQLPGWLNFHNALAYLSFVRRGLNDDQHPFFTFASAHREQGVFRELNWSQLTMPD